MPSEEGLQQIRNIALIGQGGVGKRPPWVTRFCLLRGRSTPLALRFLSGL